MHIARGRHLTGSPTAKAQAQPNPKAAVRKTAAEAGSPRLQVLVHQRLR